MQSRPALSIGAFWATFAVLVCPYFACACTIFPQTVEVGSDFRVRVMDQDRPVKGLRLALSKNGSTVTQLVEVANSFTDTDGYAYFSNLNAGSFWLGPDHDAGIGDALVVDVSPSNPKSTTVPLNWPSRAPLSVGSARGVIRGPNYYPDQTQAPLSVSLLEGVSGREIETRQTDSNGRLEFPREIAPGIYFLRLNPSNLRAWSGEQIQGMIAIEITKGAKQGTLDLDLSWSSCGLSYAQRTIQAELKLDKICGSVVDGEGAAISNAQVMLLASAENGRVLEETPSQADGRFALPDEPDGTYQLLVESPGFRPFNRLIRLQAAETSGTCQQPMRISLGVM